MRSPNNGKSPKARFLIQKFCSPQINHMEIPVLANNCVFRLQVSIYDTFRVQIFNANKQTGQIKSTCVEIQQPNLSQNIEEITSVNEFHQQVNEMLVFEGGLELDDQGKVYLDHYCSLLLNKNFHLVFHYHIFFNAFNCILYIGIVFSLDHINFTELPLTKFSHNVIIL